MQVSAGLTGEGSECSVASATAPVSCTPLALAHSQSSLSFYCICIVLVSNDLADLAGEGS